MNLVYLVCVAAIATGCASVEVDNALPGATLENVRFVTDDGDSLWMRSDRLLSGSSASASVGSSSDVVGEPGRLRFELVVDGRRVELVTREHFTIAQKGLTRIVVDADTAVESDLPGASGDGGDGG